MEWFMGGFRGKCVGLWERKTGEGKFVERETVFFLPYKR